MRFLNGRLWELDWAFICMILFRFLLNGVLYGLFPLVQSALIVFSYSKLHFKFSKNYQNRKTFDKNFLSNDKIFQ